MFMRTARNACKKNILKKKSTTRSTKIKFKIVFKFSKFFFKNTPIHRYLYTQLSFNIRSQTQTLLKNNMYNQFLLPRNSYSVARVAILMTSATSRFYENAFCNGGLRCCFDRGKQERFLVFFFNS